MSESQHGPYNAQFVDVKEYSVGTWRDGPVGSDAPVNAVVLHLGMPAMILGQVALDKQLEGMAEVGLRIKSRAAMERLVRLLWQYAEEVWPQEPGVDETTFAP